MGFGKQTMIFLGKNAMSKKDAQSYQGKVNRAQGKLFEERIDAALAYYDRLGLASVEKTPEPMRPIRSLSEGRFVAIFEKPAQPDYKGTLKGGRAVVFEAKHTSTGQMEQSRVTGVQAKRLEHHQELGALCFVVAGFGQEDVFRIPWMVWRDMKSAFGRKYVTPKDLEEYRVKLSWSGVLLLLDPVSGPKVEKREAEMKGRRRA